MVSRRIRIIQTIYLIFLCAALGLGFPAPAVVNAAESDSRPVRIGYYENEVFQEGAQEGAVKTGYAYEYYQKLSEYTGWQYEYVYGEFGDLYQMLLDGEIDFLAGLARREDREEIIGYPDMAMGNETYNLVRHDVDEDITLDPATLNGRKIGVLDSAMATVLEEFLQEHGITAEVVLYRDYEPLFAAFDSHDIDVLAAEGDGAYGRAHAELLYAFGASDYYLCVSRSRPDLLSELNIAQTELNADEPNYINTLRNRYYPVSISSRAFSADEKQWLSEHTELKTGYLENYLPYSDTDSNGEVTGLIKDLIPRMLSGLDIDSVSVTFIGFENYDEMIEALGKGEIDTAFPVGGGLYYSEESGIFQSTPVVSAATELVHMGEYTDETVANFAVNEKNRMQYYFVKTYYPDAEITFFPSIDECLKAVSSGQVGCTTLNGLRANDILRNSSYSGLSLLQTTHDDDRCFGVQIGNAGLLKILNRGISILGSEYAQNLAFRYTDQLYSYTLGDLIRNNLLLFSGIVLVIVALVIIFLVRDSRRSKQKALDQQKANEELEKSRQATQRELEERLALQKELVSALDAAEQANVAKTAFLSNMSHEIRTPMNAIIGLDSLALQNEDLPDETREYLEKIDGSAKHLLGLINDILDMSRIESGRLVINREEFSLTGMLEQINTMVMSQCEERGLEYECRIDSGLNDYYIGDEIKLKQVLINILSNAIKFTDPPGSVKLTVGKSAEYGDHSTLKFSVKDTGIGIDPEFIPKIFDAFSQEDSGRKNKYGSTGLGMAITKNIVELMNGTISVESEKGAGSEFTVVITLTNSERKETDAAVNEKEPAESDTEHVVDLKGRHILMAEDVVINAEIMKQIFAMKEAVIDHAENGKLAVEMFEKSEAGYYDAILMDLRMPEMTGLEATAAIRALDRPDAGTIPIIALTANAFDEDVQRSLQVGMNAHLSKPVEPERLFATLEELIGKR